MGTWSAEQYTAWVTDHYGVFGARPALAAANGWLARGMGVCAYQNACGPAKLAPYDSDYILPGSAWLAGIYDGEPVKLGPEPVCYEHASNPA